MSCGSLHWTLDSDWIFYLFIYFVQSYGSNVWANRLRPSAARGLWISAGVGQASEIGFGQATNKEPGCTDVSHWAAEDLHHWQLYLQSPTEFQTMNSSA